MKTIRNTLMVFLIYVITFSATNAQQVELTPFGGFQLGGRISFREGKLKFADAANYGVALDIPIRSMVMAELYYSRMESEADFSPYSNYETEYPATTFKTAVEYYQIGILKQLQKDKIAGFGGVTLGAAHMGPKTSDVDHAWRFAATFGAGLKYYATDHIGFRFQARLLMPMYFSGGGIYCGIGSGGSSCGLGLNSAAVIVQGDFTAGLIILLGT